MKQIKILVIGNSFSQDATYYVYEIAKASGINIKLVNLYIGGCSLQRHWDNIEYNSTEYLYERDGKSTGRYIAITKAIEEEEWDYVITQQASHDSGIFETYIPYLQKVIGYIREKVPNATILLQETWAYENDCKHDCFPRYHNNQDEMYRKLKDAYEKAAEMAQVKLIPCGEVIQEVRKREPFLYEEGQISLCRDGFHMHYLYGRYLLAAIWYETIFGKSILENDYLPSTELLPDEQADIKALQVIRQCVHEVASNPKTRVNG